MRADYTKPVSPELYQYESSFEQDSMEMDSADTDSMDYDEFALIGEWEQIKRRQAMTLMNEAMSLENYAGSDHHYLKVKLHEHFIEKGFPQWSTAEYNKIWTDAEQV